MRRILIDHARSKKTIKRGGDLERLSFEALSLDEIATSKETQVVDLLALDEALAEFEERDQRAAKIVKLRFFVGLSVDEIAKALGISPRTVRNEWTVSKAWLKNRLAETD